MKTFSKLVALVVVITFSTFCSSNTQKTNAKFKVFGNCEMCKKTIEKSLNVDGVKIANWDTESKIIEISYQAEKITEDKLHQLIASSGYDTEKKKGDDKAYSNLPGCCQYERK